MVRRCFIIFFIDFLESWKQYGLFAQQGIYNVLGSDKCLGHKLHIFYFKCMFGVFGDVFLYDFRVFFRVIFMMCNFSCYFRDFRLCSMFIDSPPKADFQNATSNSEEFHL